MSRYKNWKQWVERMQYGEARKEVKRLYEGVDRLIERAQVNLRKAEMMEELHPVRDVYKFYKDGRWYTRSIEKPIMDDDGFVLGVISD